MTDYQPVYLPGAAMTLTASAAISEGDTVEVSGAGTVAPVTVAADPSVKVVGLAAADTVSGDPVTVFGRGTVHESVALDTVTAGDQVGSGITGDTDAGVRTIAAPALSGTPTAAQINSAIAQARAVLGVALTTATYPAKVRWMSY